MVFTPDGTRLLTASRASDQLTPPAIGKAVAETLVRDGARDLIDAIASKVEPTESGA